MMDIIVVTIQPPVRINKICPCGKPYDRIPTGARVLDGEELLSGYYFECGCGSTLFVPATDVKAA